MSSFDEELLRAPLGKRWEPDENSLVIATERTLLLHDASSEPWGEVSVTYWSHAGTGRWVKTSRQIEAVIATDSQGSEASPNALAIQALSERVAHLEREVLETHLYTRVALLEALLRKVGRLSWLDAGLKHLIDAWDDENRAIPQATRRKFFGGRS